MSAQPNPLPNSIPFTARNSEHQPGYYVFQTVHHRGADARGHSNGRAFNNAANAVELLPR